LPTLASRPSEQTIGLLEFTLLNDDLPTIE
jgi:hypothetical protein